MKPNSLHKFDDFDDAMSFIEALTKSGFKEVAFGKDGGKFYSNGRHVLFVYVGEMRRIARYK